MSLKSVTGIVVLSAAALAACNGESKGSTESPSAPAAQSSESAELKSLRAENATLKGENERLTRQVEELSMTPEVLLTKVEAALRQDDVAGARATIDSLQLRFGQTPHLNTAKATVARYESAKAEKAALAKELEAKGFYALKPTMNPKVYDVGLKVESLKTGNRWPSDIRENGEYLYREAERGETYVLMNVSVQTESKEPLLPDVGVYVLDGKEMRRVSGFAYRFRRWQSYGTFIGLYHDYKNDFAHTSTVPFNAAAIITTDVSKRPFAVVATGKQCHKRSTWSGRPEVIYLEDDSCAPPNTLTLDDFKSGQVNVLAFFNKPKGV